MRTLSQVLICGLVTLGCASQSLSAADLADKKSLTLDGARRVAEAAEKFAAGNKWAMVIAVLDDGGNLLYLERMDGAPIGSVQVAQQKAHTSIIFKSPTKVFEDGLKKGDTSSLKLDIMPYGGGVPVTVGGVIVGAIGVSGGTAAQDAQVAQAGADWLAKNK